MWIGKCSYEKINFDAFVKKDKNVKISMYTQCLYWTAASIIFFIIKKQAKFH